MKPSLIMRGGSVGGKGVGRRQGGHCVNILNLSPYLASNGSPYPLPPPPATIYPIDGQQFMVDGDLGLAGVPEQYRDEVAQQLEASAKDGIVGSSTGMRWHCSCNEEGKRWR